MTSPVWRAQIDNPLHRHAWMIPIRLAVAMLPRSFWHPLARLCGRALPLCSPRWRRVVDDNLRRLGVETDRRPAVLRRFFGNFAVFLGDSFLLSRVTPGTMNLFFSETEGIDRLREALAGGRGALLLSAHLGLWELGGYALALSGLPVTGVSLRGADETMNRWREANRSRLGIETIYLAEGDGAARTLIAMRGALARGRVLCMLVDRATSGRSVRVRFAGQAAAFPPGGAFLALRTGAPILTACVVQGPGRRYRIVIDPPLPPPPASASRHEAVEHLCQAAAGRLAQSVAAHPDQWYNFFPPWIEEEPSFPSPADPS